MPGEKTWMILLHVWLVLAKAIGWLLTASCCTVVMADPVYRLEPIPQTEPLPPAPEHSAGNERQDAISPADARPVVHFYHTARCPPCDIAEAALRKAGIPLYVPAKPPKWVDTFPTMAWQVGDEWHYHFGWQGLALFMADYAPKRVEIAAAPGLPAIDQLKKFLPPGTKITIEPPSGVIAKLDNDVSISMKKIAATVSYEGSEVVIKLADPRPAGNYTLHTPVGAWDVGFLITDGQGPKIVDKETAEFRLGTTKGSHRFRVKMTLEPAK